MTRLLARLLAAAALVGCAPLTFSNEGSIDFERYPSCRVERVDAPDSDYATAYLVRELRASSGFAQVSDSPRTEAALSLAVRVTVVEQVRVDSDGNLDVDYEATATFTARSASDAVVDTGVIVEESESYSEALEDALDAIAHHYLFPYRA